MARAKRKAAAVLPLEAPESDPGLTASILVVDDDERNAFAITTALEDLGQQIVIARSGEEALKRLLQQDFAVILLDVHMPGMDGYETATLIRSRQRSRHIPIVFLTAVFRDDSHLLQAYSAGAVDMVFKPVDPFILKSKVAVFVDLYLRRAEVRREAELRQRLQEENFRVRTEKLVAEQALRRSEERRESILRSLPVCFHSRSASPPFGALFVSDAVERITGFPPRRFTQDPNFGLGRVHPEDLASVVGALSSAAVSGSYSCEFRWRCADDSYRCFLDQGVLAPAEDDGESAEIFGTLLDVTQQRTLEQQLVQAQKMETVGQLTGGIAHDFNNLLTVILGNLDLIERHVGGNERLKRQLVSIRHASERGNLLTRQLLAFSRKQHLIPEVIDVRSLIGAFEALLRRAAGESITLELVLSEDPVVCEVDASQLESALLNLVVNARDAMPEGGRLRIEIAMITQSEPTAIEEGGLSAPWVRISVRDEGVGMARAVRERAFEPFFTTKQAGRGSGLGLSQVYGFVRQSGGFVSLESEPSQGTNIAIHLPHSQKPLSPRPVTAAGTPGTAAGLAEQVLLVEDDPSVLALGIEMLTELGYRVKVASDAAGALEILRQGDPIDLIFTDVVMPGNRSGVQLAEEARVLRPGVKVLLTSGYPGEILAKHRIRGGDLPLIEKPYRQAELAAKLREVLASPN